MIKYIITSLLLLVINASLAQDNAAEDLLEALSDESEQSELLENIERLRESPININQASARELAALPFLSQQQARQIVEHRKKIGLFKATQGLLSLDGFDRALFEAIEPFITIKSLPKYVRYPITLNYRTRLSRQLNEPIGYDNGTYKANANKVYNRLQFEMGKTFSGGLLTEKDAGEKQYNDLTLFYLSWKVSNNIHFIVGNYQLQFGQGLTFWGPYGYSKGTNTTYPIKKRGTGFKKYLSVDENAGLFGFAATIQFNQFTFSPFVSRSELDATSISENKISGISASGFHRTESEIARKDGQRESIIGGRVQYSIHSQLRLGGTAYFSAFKKSFANADFTRNHFDFRGKSNHVLGMDWEYLKSGLEFFGEFSQSKNGGNAALAGLRIYETPLKLAFLFRKYDKDFQNFHSLGFGESSETQNETGFYSGIEYQIKSGTKLSAYYDIYKFPWRSFFEPLPRSGNDFLVQILHKLSRTTLFTLRYKQKSKQSSEAFHDSFDRDKTELIERMQRQYRVQVEFGGIKDLLIRSRIDFTKINYNPTSQNLSNRSENGLLIYQDIRLQVTQKFKLWARLSFFGTDSFDSRVFQYENDLPGVLTNRALFGQGTRWYFLLKYQFTQQISLYCKFSELYRKDVSQLGSGADLIDNNVDQRFAVQLQGRF